MKIALFADTYEPEVNGVATSVRTLREGLIARGHNVTVFAPAHPDAGLTPGVVRLPSIAFKPIHERRLATPFDLAVRAAIRDAGFDLIHTHNEFSVGQFGFRAASQLKIPHVHTYHTMYEEYTWYITRGLFEGTARRLVRRVSRYLCERCDCIIAPTKKTQDALRSYGIDTPIRIAPTGVDVSRFKKDSSDTSQIIAEKIKRDKLRAELGISQDAPVILSLGRIANEKRVKELVDSVAGYFSNDDPRRNDCVFLVVGDGPAYEATKQQVKNLGIADRVVFTGEVLWETVPQYYHVADVFVSMSESETQGLTYIESLAAGVPVVAQYNECFDGILEDRVSASLFKDPAEFSERLDEMLFSEKRHEYRKAGFEAVQAVSIGAFAKNVEGIYGQTIENYVPHPSRLRRIFPS